MFQKWLKRLGLTVVAGASVLISALFVFLLVTSVGNPGTSAQVSAGVIGVMDKYDMFMTNTISDSLDGILSIEKSYWLNDDDLVAPEPNQDRYGTCTEPAQMAPILEQAADLIQDDNLYFDPETTVLEPGKDIMYYHDETILAITWKEAHDNSMYTYSEVFIAHPSQFRRFLAGGEYGSEKQFVTTEMAASVNAVVASSGDFYRFRNYGTIVYDGQVQRIRSENVDTCFIDDQGDLIFNYRGEITDINEAQHFVDDNNIRFSLAFGPILVDDGVRCEPSNYYLGEVTDPFPRAALCQMGKLHYLLIVANSEGSRVYTPDIYGFARHVVATGCEKAYTLDGGQTAVIAMNDQLINSVHFGYQRKISDIIYFATAVPNGG